MSHSLASGASGTFYSQRRWLARPSKLSLGIFSAMTYLPRLVKAGGPDPVRSRGLDRVDDQAVDLHPDVVAPDDGPVLALVLGRKLLAYPGCAAELDGVAVVVEEMQPGDDVYGGRRQKLSA